jgi:hypothetical protein
MTWLNAPSGRKPDRLPVRAAEHSVILPSGDRKEEPSQTCTVITTLLDHQAASADRVRDTYLTRWSASEVGHRWCRSSCAAFSWLCSLCLVGLVFLLCRCPAGSGVVAGRAVPALA